MKQKKLYMISYYNYPEGDAGAVRQHNLAKVFQLSGFEPLIIGMSKKTAIDEGIKQFDGISYCSLRMKTTGYIGKFKNYYGYTRRLKKLLKQTLSESKDNSILLVDPPIQAWLFLKKLCKKNSLNMYHDSVEWYSKEQFKYGRMSPAYIKKNVVNRVLVNRHIKVISISKYLHSYFENKGIFSKYIPVIMDYKTIPYSSANINEKLKIIYAGSPGKKDYLDGIIKALLLLNKAEYQKIELFLLGITEEQLLKHHIISKMEIKELSCSLHCISRMERSSVLEFISEADFTILIRNSEQRYAKAGFPTKVVESLMVGTPVILNYSSNLKDYIIDGRHGLIVADTSAEAIASVMKKALSLSNQEKEQMRIESRRLAMDSFDYRKYQLEIQELERL